MWQMRNMIGSTLCWYKVRLCCCDHVSFHFTLPMAYLQLLERCLDSRKNCSFVTVEMNSFSILFLVFRFLLVQWMTPLYVIIFAILKCKWRVQQYRVILFPTVCISVSVYILCLHPHIYSQALKKASLLFPCIKCVWSSLGCQSSRGYIVPCAWNWQILGSSVWSSTRRLLPTSESWQWLYIYLSKFCEHKFVSCLNLALCFGLNIVLKMNMFIHSLFCLMIESVWSVMHVPAVWTSSMASWSDVHHERGRVGMAPLRSQSNQAHHLKEKNCFSVGCIAGRLTLYGQH